MAETTNIGLKKPAYGDSADVKDFNDNMDTLDTVIKQVQDDIDAIEAWQPSGNGTLDQILRSNGDGTTRWDDAATETEIGNAVTTWLDANIDQAETAAIDDTLTVAHAAAESKTTGDKISELKSAFNAAICPVSFQPSLVKGSYINSGSGTASSSKYARTFTLWAGYGSRIAIKLNNADYKCRLYFFDETGEISGTGYIGKDSYATGIHYIPDYAIKFGMNFNKVDGTDMTDADITAIMSALSGYAPTDKTLTGKGMAADALITGHQIQKLKDYNAFDVFDGIISKTNDTMNGITYSWDGDTCSISGTLSSESGSQNYLLSRTGLPDYIKPGQKLYVQTTTTKAKARLRIIFYNSSNEILSTESIGTNSVITVPNNAAKWAINIYVASSWLSTDTATVVLKGCSLSGTNANLTENLESFINEENKIIRLDNETDLDYSVGYGGFILAESGNISANASISNYTDYIDITKYKKIKYKRIQTTATGTYAGIAFYDDGKTYISGVLNEVVESGGGYASDLYETDVPNNAAYVRCTMLSDTDTYGTFEIKGIPVLAYTINDIFESIFYPIDTDNLKYGFGGIYKSGYNSDSQNRIRYRDSNGKGGISVKAGSTITANTGYKFNIALYSSYVTASNFTLIGYRTMGTDAYTVPVDCFVRISVGTTSDDELWTVDDEGLKTFTEAGEAAKSGLVLNLLQGDVKEAIDNLNEKIDNGTVDTVIELKTEIPYTATAYHALFNDLVTNGHLTRTLLGYVDDDEDYPIYQYVLRNDMNHINQSYGIVAWNGSNELYDRPKVFLDSGIHGNERTTPYVLWDFINKLCTNSAYQRLRNAFDWYFIPLVNPWGFSHTAILTSTGVVNNGSGYKSDTISDYTVVVNNSTYHQGIRRNKDGIDINRDFSAFETEEAQMFRSAIQSMTADNRNFVFAIDSHQAATGNKVNVIGAFVSLHYGAEDEDKNFIYGKLMQAGAVTERAMADYCDVANVQSVYAWDGTNLLTIRNYMKDYAGYSMCFEGGQTLIHYSGSSTWSNEIARTFDNTIYHQFMMILTEKWM